MNKFSIKDIEVLTGVKAHTLRIWEQRYQIVKPERTTTNIRFYTDEDLRKLLNITFLNNKGYKISELSKLSNLELNTEAESTGITHSGEYEAQMQALTLHMVELNQIAFEKVLSKAIMDIGLEDVIVKIVFPFLYNVGFLWQTGAISPAHEHFISNIIRQKLIVAIDSQEQNYKENSKKYLLFLPENELHEAGLLFANYVIQSRGQKVIYLGQNIPLADVASVYKIYKPDFILTAVSSPLINIESITEFLTEIALQFSETKLCIGGTQVKIFRETNFPENVVLLNTLQELIDLVTVNIEHEN
jgi:MerR family transcriptional regulator, light-induced transcriptional regulator